MTAPAPGLPPGPHLDYISDVQRSIVTDHHRIKLVNGCAGSRKTDTIVKLGALHLERYGHSLLFLTLVSSITHEIRQRLEELLGMEIPRIGSSNHFVGEYRGKHVAIANFDAFVHKQLEHSGGLGDQLRENGDCHDWKTSMLLELTRSGAHRELVMKTGQAADMVLVDEFQDMDPSKARILTNILRHNPRLYGIAVGDMMQTIFPRAVDTDLALGHPMNIWKSQLAPVCYFIDTCYRCPPPHVEFVRMLLGEQYRRYDVPAMVAFERDKGAGDAAAHRPVLFCHDKLSKNQTAYSIAQQVCSTLRVLFRHDASLKPADVAVIMKKSNNNHVFEQLKVGMQHLFDGHHQLQRQQQQQQRQQRQQQGAREPAAGAGAGAGAEAGADEEAGPCSSASSSDGAAAAAASSSALRVVHFETRGDGYHNSIDWARADGKAVLLSIHGDKGKGHRVVFFLGLSHKCIPSENNLFKTAELVDVSLVNVALTRSTRYLFVGFTLDAPSRYLVEREGELGAHAYTSWSAHEWSLAAAEGSGDVCYLPAAPPSPYRECITAMNAALSEHRTDAYAPNFERELRTTPLSCPSRDIVRIKDDVAKDLSTVFERVLSDPAFQPDVAAFGTKVRLPSQRSGGTALAASDSTTAILGVMGELLVYRYIHQKAAPGAQTFLRRTFGPILADDRVVYTEDDRVLNIVCDHGLNQHARDEELWSQTLKAILSAHARFMDKNPDVRHFFVRLSSRLAGSKDSRNSDRAAAVTALEEGAVPVQQDPGGHAALPAPVPAQGGGPVYVLSHVFSSQVFRRQLRVFMGKEKSADISARVFWNVALCFNELYDTVRRPSVLVHFNCFNDNIKDLHSNVDAFCDAHVRDHLDGSGPTTVTLQAYHKLLMSERDPVVLATKLGFVNHIDIDADKFKRGYTYGIVGRSDMLVETLAQPPAAAAAADEQQQQQQQQQEHTGAAGRRHGVIYEFKTSARVDVSREWVAQALMYCCIPPVPGPASASSLAPHPQMNSTLALQCNTPAAATENAGAPHAFVIVNLLLGSKYTYSIPGQQAPAADADPPPMANQQPAFDRRELLVRVLQEYGFQDWMVSNLTDNARTAGLHAGAYASASAGAGDPSKCPLPLTYQM